MGFLSANKQRFKQLEKRNQKIARDVRISKAKERNVVRSGKGFLKPANVRRVRLEEHQNGITVKTNTPEKPIAPGLYSLPMEVIQQIFLMSGNLEFPNCSKLLHKILNGSRYLQERMVYNVSSSVLERVSNKESEEDENNEDNEESQMQEPSTTIRETPIRVLNSRFLSYKFVNREFLEHLNICYASPDFPINNDEHLFVEDIASVPIPQEFNNYMVTPRMVGLYLHLLKQPNCVGQTGLGKSIFLNLCLSNGFLKEANEILATGKVTADDSSLRIALELDDEELFAKLVEVPSSPDVLNNDYIWEILLHGNLTTFASILKEAGGHPSLGAISSSLPR